MIRGVTLKNCKVTEDYVKRMFDIWIADVEAIKGKSTRKLLTESKLVLLPCLQKF